DDIEDRETRKRKHAAWLKQEQADSLHDARVELVRRHLLNPSQPLDWPNWKQPHELWFTGHEDYWLPLARAKQAEMDKAAGQKPSIASPILDQNPVTENPVDILSPTLSTVDTAPVHIKPVDTRVDSTSITSESSVDTAADRRRAYKREWMRAKRASSTQ